MVGTDMLKIDRQQEKGSFMWRHRWEGQNPELNAQAGTCEDKDMTGPSKLWNYSIFSSKKDI